MNKRITGSPAPNQDTRVTGNGPPVRPSTELEAKQEYEKQMWEMADHHARTNYPYQETTEAFKNCRGDFQQGYQSGHIQGQAEEYEKGHAQGQRDGFQEGRIKIVSMLERERARSKALVEAVEKHHKSWADGGACFSECGRLCRALAIYRAEPK